MRSASPYLMPRRTIASVFSEPGIDTILIEVMSRITVYTTEPCGYCRTAKALLKKRNIPFEEINLAKDPEGRAELVRLTGMMTFPQVVIDGEPIGGYQELVAADRVRPARRVQRGPAGAPRPPAGSARRRRSRARPRAACAPGRRSRTHGCPSRRWIRNWSWNDAVRPVGRAEVVDRGALGLEPGLQRRDDRVAQRDALRPAEPVRGPQRVQPGAEQRLVGVDVPHARDPLLVEQERLDRRARRARERVQVVAGELVAERLDAEAGGEERVQRVRRRARAPPCRSAAGRRRRGRGRRA